MGAFIFGLLADRYGRRLPLMIDLVFYSVVEVLSGLAPNFTVFLVLRALFGIGMGGEWGVGRVARHGEGPAALARRAVGLPAGGLRGRLPARCALLLLRLPASGAGGRCSSSAACPRCSRSSSAFTVKESAVWESTRHGTWRDLGRGIAAQWKLFLYLTALMTMMNFVSHGTQDMYPTFLREHRGFSSREKDLIVVVYNVGALLGGICFGFFSDRFGRRRAMVTALLLAILMIPLWAYAPTTALLVIGAFLMQFMVQGAWGVVPAHITELSPDSVRGFLPGFAYQLRRGARGDGGVHRGGLRAPHQLRERDGPHRAHGLHARGGGRGARPGAARSDVRPLRVAASSGQAIAAAGLRAH